MDSSSLPSTSATPASTSRTIPIQLTATPATKIPEVHIKEIPETDEISEVSEVSQSVCHVIKIRKLNRPSSMYNNAETNAANANDKKETAAAKVDSNDMKKSETIMEEAAAPSKSDTQVENADQASTPPKEAPSEKVKEPENSIPVQPIVEEPQSIMSLQKEEEKEEIDQIIPAPNLIGIKAVGIITACEGPDNVTSEEISSLHAKADAPKESPQNPPSESGPPKSWIHKKRDSLNSGSSQFDVSEIPLDVVETNDANSDAFILESAPNESKNEKDEVNATVTKVEDETSKPPKSPKTKVFVQVHSNAATTSSETTKVGDNEQKVEEPSVQPQEPFATTSVETYDFKIEPSHEVIEPQDIQVTSFQVAEDVSTQQSNENPIMEEAQIVKTSESHPSTEEINVVQYREEPKAVVEQISPSSKADLIPHESMEDKIHVPKDRPKSAASLEHEHRHEANVENVVEAHEKPSLSKIEMPDKNSPDYNPMDDPHSPDYRPIIHQSSFEIPIIFEKKSTGEGPVRTGFTVDELPWEQDVSESAKSEDIKITREKPGIPAKETVEKEETKVAAVKDVESDIQDKEEIQDLKSETVKESEIVKTNDIQAEHLPPTEPPKLAEVEEKMSTSIVDQWQALEDIDEEPSLELHVLEKIPEEPQQQTSAGEQQQPIHEILKDKKHEEILAEKPPPTEPPKIDEEVNIHFPLERSLEETQENKRTPPPTTKPNSDSVVRTISESSPDHDEDTTTYYSIATQNTVTQDDIAIDPEEERKVVAEAVEVQKETERMISEDNDEPSISTSFYSVSEKLSSKSEEENDREKTPAANEVFVKMTESNYENKPKENVADLIPHEKDKDKIHVPHDKPKPAAMLEHEKDKTAHRRQIPVIIETKSTEELDGDDISVTVEDATVDDGKPQIILRKDKQRQNNSEDTSPRPIVAVAPTSRTSENEKQQRQEEKKEESQVIIGVTRPTSVIRTDENDDSEAPLIRVKRKDLAELEDILGGDEIKVEKHEHKFDEIVIQESSRSPKELERKPSTPFYDESQTSEVPIKYRNREAKLIQRLSEQSTTPTQNEEENPSKKINGFHEKKKQPENLFPKQQNEISESSKKASMTESIIRDLREVNHELTHSPKSPSPGRHDECLSPRTLTRFHNPPVVFEKGGDKNEGGEVIHHHPVFVKDTSKYWYKPTISREEAINMLRDKSPGTFVVRDSNSFPGAFGLALKVAKPPDGVLPGDGSELVRHFLIEPSSKGVKLKGCNNEPVFGTLAALVYQHSITPMALPCRLLLPEYDPASTPEHLNAAQALLEQGAACNVTYIYSFDTESLTGPEAVRRAVHEAMEQYTRGIVRAVNVHFKVSSQGITLTDNTRTLFFRRHYPTNSVIYAGIDPEDRKWDNNSVIQLPPTYVRQARIFGFVARKISTKADNACHVFAELDPEQPATAVVNFITKVMMGNSEKRGRTLPPI